MNYSVLQEKKERILKAGYRTMEKQLLYGSQSGARTRARTHTRAHATNSHTIQKRWKIFSKAHGRKWIPPTNLYIYININGLTIFMYRQPLTYRDSTLKGPVFALRVYSILSIYLHITVIKLYVSNTTYIAYSVSFFLPSSNNSPISCIDEQTPKKCSLLHVSKNHTTQCTFLSVIAD